MSIDVTAAPEVVYPGEDGQPLAETQLHVQAIILLMQAFEDYRPEALVCADQFWYYEEGNPAARRAPDVMVVLGVPKEPPRNSYMSWREGGVVPSVIVEVSSDSTWQDDLGDKFRVYESLGVPEYFLFDPEDEYLPGGPLVGYRHTRGRYRTIKADREGGLECRRLGLFLRAEGPMLRLIDAKTGRPIPTRSESVAAESRRADEKSRRVEELESELARLRQLLGGQSDLPPTA